jgi:putative two-component system response regulator
MDGHEDTRPSSAADAIEQAETRRRETRSPSSSLAKEIAHWHHEKWDGSGYPDGARRGGDTRRGTI